jgi:hypothetical protein
MSDRKYRQSGYQDDAPRERKPALKRPAEPHDPRMPRDPRTPNLPAFREGFRCARCGHGATQDVQPENRCSKCGVDLHACIHCASFDSGARFECRQTIPARVSPKDVANTCSLFAPRISVERETGSQPAAGGSSARKAFDDLFKF